MVVCLICLTGWENDPKTYNLKFLFLLTIRHLEQYMYLRKVPQYGLAYTPSTQSNSLEKMLKAQTLYITWLYMYIEKKIFCWLFGVENGLLELKHKSLKDRLNSNNVNRMTELVCLEFHLIILNISDENSHFQFQHDTLQWLRITSKFPTDFGIVTVGFFFLSCLWKHSIVSHSLPVIGRFLFYSIIVHIESIGLH